MHTKGNCVQGPSFYRQVNADGHGSDLEMGKFKENISDPLQKVEFTTIFPEDIDFAEKKRKKMVSISNCFDTLHIK